MFFSMVSFVCWLLFRYPFHPRNIAVARKRSGSFCQKCRWQVTAKHACTLRMWLCMKWRDMVHGCTVYTEHAETAAVWGGTSYVIHHLGGYSKARYFKKSQWLIKITFDKSARSELVWVWGLSDGTGLARCHEFLPYPNFYLQVHSLLFFPNALPAVNCVSFSQN